MLIIIVIFSILNIPDLIQELLAKVKNISLINYKQQISVSLRSILYRFISNLSSVFSRSSIEGQEKIEPFLMNNTKLEVLFFCLADGAILLDSELKILLVNPKAIVQLDWSNKSITGRYIFDLLPGYINNQLLPVCNDILAESCYNNFVQKTCDLCIKIQSRKTRNLRFIFTVVSQQNYLSIQGIVITIQDVEMKLSIMENNQISTLSHELYTPLSNIRSFLETLYEYYDILSKIKKLEFLKIANQETIRLTNLVQYMLDLSSVESQYNYIKDEIDILNIVNYVIHTYQIIAQHKRIQLILESSNRVLPVIGNYNLLIQVINNLIGNAIKFTHVNSYIIVRAYNIVEKLEKYPSIEQSLYLCKVRVEIIDEGVGIHKTLQQKIFQRFSRANNNFSILQGKGLGLAIVKTIINKHSSSIYIYSESHIGSCFWFDLPVVTVRNA